MDLNLSSKTELLAMCQELGINKYKSKTKSDLIKLINTNTNTKTKTKTETKTDRDKDHDKTGKERTTQG